MADSVQNENYRSGYVALVWRPNAGKSMLMRHAAYKAGIRDNMRGEIMGLE